MNWSVKIGTVKGIEIRIHFTFLLIIVWAAMEGVLRSGSGWSRAIFGVLSTCLLFVCVVLHELGHSLVTIRLGGRVRNITLLPIGGVAQIESLPDRPLAELAIAIAGPAVNFAIAAGLAVMALPVICAEIPTDLLANAQPVRAWYVLFIFVVRLLFHLLDGMDWKALLLYLVGANVSLGVFNLLPAFPMDGGRVLRGLLGLYLSHLRATQIAIHVGQAFAVVLGFVGILSTNWMLVLIAVFIFISAGQEGQAVEARVILENLRVEQVLNRLVPRLSPLHSLAQVLDLASRSQQVNFPVMQGNQLVGVLTQDDVLDALHQYGVEVRVGRVMRRQFPIVHPTDTLLHAQQLIVRSGMQALPVVDRDTVLGLVSLQDINAAYFSAIPRPAR